MPVVTKAHVLFNLSSETTMLPSVYLPNTRAGEESFGQREKAAGSVDQSESGVVQSMGRECCTRFMWGQHVRIAVLRRK